MAARKQSVKWAMTTVGRLHDMAGNVWWSWQPRVRRLYEEADPRAYAASDQNPVRVVRKLSMARQRALEKDTAYSRRVRAAHAALQRYLRQKTWFDGKYGRKVKGVTAYFCMEYATHESLPLYAGGLGVLAGDHLKSASDLGLPFVAVGIYWKRGYTRQHVDKGGHPTDKFPVLKPDDTPLVEVTTPGGRPLRFKIAMAKESVTVRAWRLDVGRVPLYLLDTDLPTNRPADRRLTHVLYSGDRETRIRQEVLLGIGGWRLLRALKIPVAACHLNEGHAAFLSLERIAERMQDKGESFARARRYVTNTNVFTTHTPVPAGNEEFDPALIDKYMSGYLRRLKIDHQAFHDLARVRPGNRKENYGMTPLALRTSRYANGVAALHGKIARGMWKGIYPGKTTAQVPIGHVTNGIHLETWLHPEMSSLFDQVLGTGWQDRQDSAALWKRCAKIADGDLWGLHQQFKTELVSFCRDRLRSQWRASRPKGVKLGEVDGMLDPEALTIGFARRFAPYKRANLVFTDPARLARILNQRKMPVQLIFAGKAHPADMEGKALIETLVAYTRQSRFRRRVIFIEDYEMEVARHMVAGVDVWLNNPQRPREASGTSGMKPALHGGLNLSILDGWWPEGYNRRNGWAIGDGRDYNGTQAADRRDAASLYRLLEHEVVPLYYDRVGGLPKRWMARMRQALMSVPPVFNTHRQVKEYWSRYYLPAMRKAKQL